MNTNIKFIVIGVVLLAAIVGGTLLLSNRSTGGSVETDFHSFGGGLSIGDPGSLNNPKAAKLTFVKAGTCNPAYNGTSLLGTTTGQMICRSVLGVKSGDRVFISLPSGSRIAANSWFEAGDGYATTSDQFGFDMSNWTGAATSSFPLATTSVQYLIARTSTNP